jgi:hypothetical protein
MISNREMGFAAGYTNLNLIFSLHYNPGCFIIIKNIETLNWSREADKDFE